MALLADCIFAQTDQVIALQKAMTAIPALGPENGGDGEAEKAAFLAAWLRKAGISDMENYPSPDPRVSSGRRPNLLVRVKGASAKSLWLFGHMDVVPPGERSLWAEDPWQVCQKGDLLVGRGVEDNQQAIVSMLILAKCLKELAITPVIGLNLVFMADEENGSQHGLDWLLRKHPELFSPSDLYLVPDGGSPDGSVIEIAEKAQLWLKFTVTGLQCHASTPQKGNNALVAAAALILRLQNLNLAMTTTNSLFHPPRSTFTPTKHMQNVDAVNILPGREEFYLDCRLLPELPIEAALDRIAASCAEVEQKFKTDINMQIVQRQPATCTAPNAPVVTSLARAIARVCHRTPELAGIGGATVAALLRERGLEAAVWSTILNTCHQPNEASSIKATLQDAAVFGQILLDTCNA